MKNFVKLFKDFHSRFILPMNDPASPAGKGENYQVRRLLVQFTLTHFYKRPFSNP